MIAEEVDLYGQIEAVDLVVTGEGALDDTSFEGKVVGGVLRLAEAAGVAVVAVVGSAAPTPKRDWPIEVIDLSEIYGKARAVNEASGCVTEALSDWLSRR